MDETSKSAVQKKNVSLQSLNMGKQFTKFASHCERKELSKINESKGSDGLVVVDFRAGAFDAMRKLLW